MIKSMIFVAAAMIAAPALAQTEAPARPFCSAKVTDGCQQTASQQAREMSGAQADARDARNGGVWTPNKASPAATKMAAMKK